MRITCIGLIHEAGQYVLCRGDLNNDEKETVITCGRLLENLLDADHWQYWEAMGIYEAMQENTRKCREYLDRSKSIVQSDENIDVNSPNWSGVLKTIDGLTSKLCPKA